MSNAQYDQGGQLPESWSAIHNSSGKAEYILTPADVAKLRATLDDMHASSLLDDTLVLGRGSALKYSDGRARVNGHDLTVDTEESPTATPSSRIRRAAWDAVAVLCVVILAAIAWTVGALAIYFGLKLIP